MTKHIMVGYDESPESSDALRWAAGEACAREVQLRIVTCYRVPASGDVYGGWIPAEAYDSLMRSAADGLKEAREAAERDHPELEVSTDLFAGSASAVLVEEESSETVLIALGASSHKGASAFWMGSTPRAVIRHATCPVVVVRGGESHACPERVVAGIDTSDVARIALGWAAAEADFHGVQLHVVHAWQYPYHASETSGQQAHDLTHVDASLVLNDAVEWAREQCRVDVVGQLAEDSPAVGLLGTVRDGDLLVLGSRGQGALRASVFGSTVNTVLDHADVTVAVVR